MLKAKQLAGLAEPGLSLVHDQQHATLSAGALYPLVKSLRRHDHAAGAQHGLADEGGGLAGEIGIRELQARVQALNVAVGILETERATVAIRREHR